MALFSDGLSYPCPRIPGVISHFLGCFCRAWDDDDLGVYQGAYSVAPLPITLSPNAQCVCSYVDPIFSVRLGSGCIHPSRLCRQSEFFPPLSCALSFSPSSSICCVS